MITRNLILTITDKDAKLDKAVILYRYDRGITLNFKLESKEYLFEDPEIISARTLILAPNKRLSTSEITDIVDGVYTLVIDNTWTDELIEIGTYTLQIQLYSSNQEDECISLPPITIQVRDLIGVPTSTHALTGYATVGNYSATPASDLPTGDLENGEYLNTNWIDNDLITSGKLNKIESVLSYLVGDASTHASESYVNEAIANLPTGDIDLSEYATKNEVNQLIGDINSILDSINGE